MNSGSKGNRAYYLRAKFCFINKAVSVTIKYMTKKGFYNFYATFGRIRFLLLKKHKHNEEKPQKIYISLPSHAVRRLIENSTHGI